LISCRRFVGRGPPLVNKRKQIRITDRVSSNNVYNFYDLIENIIDSNVNELSIKKESLTQLKVRRKNPGNLDTILYKMFVYFKSLNFRAFLF
jgi:hypothetical protein